MLKNVLQIFDFVVKYRMRKYEDILNKERRIVMEKFLTEALKTGQGVELGDALSVGGMVTGVGLGIVFGVLIILMIVLMLFKVIFYRPEAKTTQVKNEAPSNSEKSVSVNESPNDETTAVIAAAIASSMDTPMDKIRIKSIKKI